MCISKLKFEDSSVEILQREQLEQEICNVASYFEKVLLVCNIDKDESLLKLDKNRYELNLFLKLLAHKYAHISVFDSKNFLNSENIKLDLEDITLLIDLYIRYSLNMNWHYKNCKLKVC